MTVAIETGTEPYKGTGECITAFPEYVTTEKKEEPKEEPSMELVEGFKEEPEVYIWTGPKLTPEAGVNYGPSGKETYYNLPMGGVIEIMRNCGYSVQEYPFWVREDGVKMLGNYVMVAAALDIRPRGSLIETSLGTGIVCDTGAFVYSDPTQIDIAVTW